MPDLQLDDIMHNMSPSPAPQQPDSVQVELRSASPEPLTEAEVARMRYRVAQIGLALKETGIMNDREKELISMVHRLTSSPLIDPSQLIHQAEVISGLTSQRDFLIRQAEEERERWLSEKDGWTRMAEALIAQRNKTTTNGSKDVDLERYCAAYESDNRALREKLNDTQTRLQCLEAELSKLRPILLMHPVTSQAPSSVPYPSVRAATEKAKPRKKTKKEARVPVFSPSILGEPDVSDDQIKTQPMEVVGQSSASASSSFFQFQAQAPPTSGAQPSFTGDHYRKPTTAPVGGPLSAPPTTLEFQVNTPSVAGPSGRAVPRTIRRASPPPSYSGPGPSSSTTNALSAPGPAQSGSNSKTRSKFRRSQGALLTPLTSDARTEHLLLAARKIGRERAGIVAGYVRDNKQREADVQKQEKERERALREERADRGSGGASYYRPEVGGGTAAGTPQTPKRGNSHYPNAGASPRVVNSSFVMVEPSNAGSAGNDDEGQSWSHAGTAMQHQDQRQQQQQVGNGHNSGTPRPEKHAGAVSGSQQFQAPGGNPSTPLASLLDAARMMDDDAGTDTRDNLPPDKGRRNGVNGSNDTNTTDRRRAVEQPEGPAPKRRRVQSARAAASVTHLSRVRVEEPEPERVLGRVKSALDVLADQAAAFSSHDQRGKGKARLVLEEHEEGEERDANHATTPLSATKKVRGRGKVSAKEKEKEKPKSKTKPATTRKPRAKTVVSTEKAPVATVPPAVPRMISPPGPRLSTSTFGGPGSASGGVTGISSVEVLLPRRRVPEEVIAPVGQPGVGVFGEANPSSGAGPDPRGAEVQVTEFAEESPGEEGEGGEGETKDTRTGGIPPAPPPEMHDYTSTADTAHLADSKHQQESEIQEVDPHLTGTQEPSTTGHDVRDMEMDVAPQDDSRRTLESQTGRFANEADDENREQETEQDSENLDTTTRQPSSPHSPPSHRPPDTHDIRPPPADRGENGADADFAGEADADAEADLDEGDVDADGEVDAEGELDLEELDGPFSTPPPAPNLNNTAGAPGMPNGNHSSSHPTSTFEDASLAQ
ncbi:hypothetical protein LshimejAT787_0111890 [Lyophyllum shimeji]|uniref:Uncharacterized protein n=1 Tax=Lyophyllum shimeji TaxID=47721 RepID=A0A9P3PE65_LYOSH|nr:hypothetical protein LshimejAT787_0111890 [Lyophyllum shimeji]